MSNQSESANEELQDTANGKPETKCPTPVCYNWNLITYVIFAAFRVILTLIPQTGYIQPDEYFQSLEIVNEDIFGVEATRPWEFNATKPIRSVTFPYLYVGLPIFLLKCFATFIRFWFNFDILTPYFFLVIPRLSCCLISFVNDWCLYKICKIYGLNYKKKLLTLASSYVLLVYATHTFSNAVEMALMSLLIYYVAKCMRKSHQIITQDEYLEECHSKAESMTEKVSLNQMRKALPRHSLDNCFTIASITVLGVFNRPTFLAFAFSPVFYWLQRGLGSKHVGFTEFHIRIILLGITAVPLALILILIDSFYFGYLTWSEILHDSISLQDNFVVTPYNFIQYNAYTSNLANHGLHPRITHLLFNIPLLYNVLGIVAIITIFKFVYWIFKMDWKNLPRVQSIVGLMIASHVIPIALLSIFPHQEPRFLIPVTLPIVFLHSQSIHHVKQKKEDNESNNNQLKETLLKLWFVTNMFMVLVYGFFHQAGVYPLMNHLSVVMKEKPKYMTFHLVTSYVYPLPLSLLHLEHKTIQMSATNKRFQPGKEFFTYEMGLSDTVENATLKAMDVLDNAEYAWKTKRLQYRVYLAIPSSRLNEFHTIANELNVTYDIEHIFFPHVTTEVLPNFSISQCDVLDPSKCDLSTVEYLENILVQLSLSLIRIGHTNYASLSY